MSAETLIVVAAYDDSFRDNIETFQGGEVVVMDTSGGGYPTGAYINAYRKYYAHSYLFIQDSLRGNGDVVRPFREKQAPVVAWGSFPMFFDEPQQANWVAEQLPPPWPSLGIFGPVFFATRKAMKRLEDRRLLPRVPPSKLMEQGCERAWAIAFSKAGYGVSFLGPCITDGVSSRLFPEHPVFTKTFAGRT